jgi:hypothetical protein
LSDADDKLSRDVEIISAMAENMRSYLLSETLFYPLSGSNMPRLTLGGYLLRQHRLSALRDLLTPEDQATLQAAMSAFSQATDNMTVLLEKKAHREIDARLRQWTETVAEYLRDVSEERSGAHVTYRVAGETRAMISALFAKLLQYPFELDGNLELRVRNIDRRLQTRWRDGTFIWDDSWIPAYPKEEYWYLYGEAY